MPRCRLDFFVYLLLTFRGMNKLTSFLPTGACWAITSFVLATGCPALNAQVAEDSSLKAPAIAEDPTAAAQVQDRRPWPDRVDERLEAERRGGVAARPEGHARLDHDQQTRTRRPYGTRQS